MENCSFSISITVEDQPLRRSCIRRFGVYLLKLLILILVLVGVGYIVLEIYLTVYPNSETLNISSSTIVYPNTTMDAAVTTTESTTISTNTTSTVVTSTENPWSTIWPPFIRDNSKQ